MPRAVPTPPSRTTEVTVGGVVLRSMRRRAVPVHDETYSRLRPASSAMPFGEVRPAEVPKPSAVPAEAFVNPATVVITPVVML